MRLTRWLSSMAISALLASPALAQDGGKPPGSAPADAVPATTSGTNSEVAPGPLIEARRMLWLRLDQAKTEGIGTTAYVAAFKGIEDEVKAGKTAEDIKPRIESLARSLKEQLERSKILKTQRPIPPTASQSGGSSGGGGGPASGASGGKGGGLSAALGGGDGDLIGRIKDKLLNGGDIPDSLKQKAMQSEKGRKLLEKLGL
jgi:hypothetical protein